MGHNEDKQIEKLIDKMMKEIPLETPSVDFTSNVMSHVNLLSSRDVMAYKPLISGKVWFIIAIVLLALTLYIAFGMTLVSTGFMAAFDFNSISNDTISKVLSDINLSDFKITRTVGYALFLLGVMVCVQIPLLHHRFNMWLKNKPHLLSNN